MKTFREFLQLREAGGLWATQGEPGDNPRPQTAGRNKDPYNKKFGVGGQGMMTGTGPGMGGMFPVRMKKMEKK